MRKRFLTGLGLIAGFGALLGAVGVGGVAAQPTAKRMNVHCTVRAYSVTNPQLSSGLVLGVEKCSQPFGDGVQQATSTTSIVGTQLNVTSRFKNFFDNGTDQGTVKLSGKLGSGAITASGPVILTGGTGAYRHIKGTGRTSCTTTDAGKTYNCTVNGTARL